MFFSKKKNKWILAAVVIILLLVIAYTGEKRERLTFPEEIVMYLVAPAQDLFTSLGQNIQTFFASISQYREIKEENERLRQKVSRVQEEMVDMEEIRQENRRFRDMLDFKEKQEMELLAAGVVARDPTRWFDTLTLNRGYRHGVEVEMAVITHRGVVGMVSSVSANSSQVLLVTNPRLRISAMSQDSRDPVLGFVEGRTDQREHLRVKMDHMPPEAEIKPGDVIVTSNIGTIFPGGIYVGEVREVDVDMFGLVKYATIEPSVNFNRLEEVFIVTSPVQEEPRQEEHSADGEDVPEES